MSTKRPPLFDIDQTIGDKAELVAAYAAASAKDAELIQRLVGALDWVAAYEAARAKDAKLIQQLVDALDWVASYDNGCPLPTWQEGYDRAWQIANEARAQAAEQGFKPSEE